MAEPVDLAQRQLDAYNVGDIDAFVACYAEDVRVSLFPSEPLILEGRAALRARYGPYFERSAPQATLVKRMVLGAVVIDEESVMVRGSSAPIHAIAIYECSATHIVTVRFIK